MADANQAKIEKKLNLILKNQCLLFWLITQSPGVARYASHVEHFSNLEVELGVTSRERADEMIEGYRKNERAK
jgi:hypothetical protein